VRGIEPAPARFTVDVWYDSDMLQRRQARPDKSGTAIKWQLARPHARPQSDQENDRPMTPPRRIAHVLLPPPPPPSPPLDILQHLASGRVV